ncbi:exopolysaccharide biosynthesis protein [Nitrococcus mobilis]|uniref:Probable exopolysaccharide synthesis protein n=1 Tax=Nitrococcus mobilis Nb-231 TaxID=314278 RepID=A4BLE9_9GAMM|nr:exopolysaccharide biosynthesis protein [Nitrococcus mobilis]EAR23137.1 probable exopolysaccharide synthesis protein [Nitrococcus mobilis Nb-231]
MQEVNNLEQLLERIDEAADSGGQVSLREIMETVGRRSFGPILLLAGLISAVPVIGGIPGVPIAMGLFVLLTAGQLLFRRRYFWLPRWLIERSVARGKIQKALRWLRRPARSVDRLLRPRLRMFTQGIGTYAIALTCVLIAAAMPLMELVPFSAGVAGLAIAAFGLALIANDGLLALFAYFFTAATFATILYGFA